MDITCQVQVEFRGFSTTKPEVLECSSCRGFVGNCFTLRGKGADSEARCTDFRRDLSKLVAANSRNAVQE